MRWFVAVFAVILILIFVGWGLSFVARSLFGSTGSSDPTTEQVEGASVESVKFMKLTVEGPIVSTSEHRSYVVEVSRNVVSMKVSSDYGQKVLKEKNYQNNDSSYEALLEALKKIDVPDRIQDTDAEEDNNYTGACPTGKRYILDIGEDVRRWDTSCKKINGTAGFEMNTVRTLFDGQIPEDDFSKFLEDTGLKN